MIQSYAIRLRAVGMRPSRSGTQLHVLVYTNFTTIFVSLSIQSHGRVAEITRIIHRVTAGVRVAHCVRRQQNENINKLFAIEYIGRHMICFGLRGAREHLNTKLWEAETEGKHGIVGCANFKDGLWRMCKSWYPGSSFIFSISIRLHSMHCSHVYKWTTDNYISRIDCDSSSALC